MKYQIRNRTTSDISLCFTSCISGLSLRNTAKALSWFVNKSHVAIWDWIQEYKPKRFFAEKQILQNL